MVDGRDVPSLEPLRELPLRVAHRLGCRVRWLERRQEPGLVLAVGNDDGARDRSRLALSPRLDDRSELSGTVVGPVEDDQDRLAFRSQQRQPNGVSQRLLQDELGALPPDGPEEVHGVRLDLVS